ncbi:scarecrow-like protein 9 [Iris pallida]|uniref:Scarecrow-like protein 9 n=1 Tax=Iris pallida TaxID=29817 RepID=A0AAX6FX03_IRIPA|nr:scarecrow-like protein 9 [Iris pallida]
MVVDTVIMDGFRFNDCFSSSSSSDQNRRRDNGGFRIEDPPAPPQRFLDFAAPNAAAAAARPRAAPGPLEDSDVFSDVVLSYISRMLMEEDVDEKVNALYQESPAIRAAEKPFYDILGEKYPHDPYPSSTTTTTTESTDDRSNGGGGSSNSSNRWLYSSQSSVSPSNSAGSVVESPESQQAWHFRKGMEEARKFLPSYDKLVVDSEANGFSFSRGRRKNPSIEELELAHGRSNKQSAVSAPSEETIRSDMFDKVLLCNGDKCKTVSALREAMQNGGNRGAASGAKVPGGGGGKTRGGKKQTKKEVVDLRTLLVHCAQAVAADDRRTANELLKQIRKSSSPFGDGSQRLAHCFADGLEARLAGTGSQIYQSILAKRTTATDILKAYQLYLAACPFKRVSHFYSNRTILNAAEKATRVHIIDFGIYYGFQWPCLIQRLSTRLEGPPRLRITGIDVPQPGFRPTERIEETGKRLADYARSFNVPFEYNAIASKWETIRVEDLRIDKGEVLVVNCLYRFRNLVDETVVVDSPRNRVLNTIREADPDVFIHGIVNGSYSAPFFVTRFREALFHYSALFDMLETNVPREDAQRLHLERDLFGQEALNVISCEGSERVERPETYKQWQVRNLRAGFRQLPLNPEIMKNARDKVKGCYHKDFVIDEDSQWLLQGWKGRIIYALSTWKPNKN